MEYDNYKVYKIEPNQGCYSGVSLVAAKNADEANIYIKNFKDRDKNNYADSYGYSYVNETDVIEGLYSVLPDLVWLGIYYRG